MARILLLGLDPETVDFSDPALPPGMTVEKVHAGITVALISRTALFLAGKAFVRYRAAGGIRTGVLADFFIGAHAAVEQLPLLTRDARRYRNYFPTVVLIAPENER